MNLIVPTTLLGIPLVQIVGLYAMLNLHNTVTMPGFLVFPVMTLNSFVNNIFTVTLASHLHNSSEQVLVSLGKNGVKSQGSGRSKALFRRELKSCSMLKIKFGSNFIDRTTPLVIQNLCLNETMSLTLIKAGRHVRSWKVKYKPTHTLIR